MKKIALVTVLSSFLLTTNIFSEVDSILSNRILATNKRYTTFAHAFHLMKKRKVKIIVETGMTRSGGTFEGDGGSTILFSEWAKQNGAILFSVDIDPNAIENAQPIVEQYGPIVALVQGDSVAFLANFKKKIDFLYLDSFDYDPFNPMPSQKHHLKEIIAAYPHLTKHSIVMIDDCDLPHGGKGILAIRYLKKRGWKIAMKGYQVILVR